MGYFYGGYVFGLLFNYYKIFGFYVYGIGVGWYGYMFLLEKLKVFIMWNVVLLILMWWKGYCVW